MKRSRYANELVREWVLRNDDFVCQANGPVANEVINAWIAAHKQPPFVLSSHIEGDTRQVTLFCTQCVDLHYFSSPEWFGSLNGETVKAQCPEKYRTALYYKITDADIKHKHLSRRVKTYETVSTEV